GRKKSPVPKSVPNPKEKHKEILDYKLLPGGILVLKITDQKEPKKVLEKMFKTPGYKDVRIMVLQSKDIDLNNQTELIWGMFTRFDPYLDVIFEHTELRGSAVIYDGRMGIDATYKNSYPNVIEMSSNIKQKVSKRWKDYWKQ
ncbi:MAG: hypothetical protein GWO07_14490, partial [Candidatus Dadabacteria bacterium]|nr:hypothetical protein [Candidatus Dadabacteria bacterium]NIV41792.1 hypothetical protein [Candidatus Dadabacteria bacterium]NIX16340.1 hypothetical protein [Candidatus Dadabacteria bacterium]